MCSFSNLTFQKSKHLKSWLHCVKSFQISSLKLSISDFWVTWVPETTTLSLLLGCLTTIGSTWDKICRGLQVYHRSAVTSEVAAYSLFSFFLNLTVFRFLINIFKDIVLLSPVLDICQNSRLDLVCFGKTKAYLCIH